MLQDEVLVSSPISTTFPHAWTSMPDVFLQPVQHCAVVLCFVFLPGGRNSWWITLWQSKKQVNIVDLHALA